MGLKPALLFSFTQQYSYRQIGSAVHGFPVTLYPAIGRKNGQIREKPARNRWEFPTLPL